MDLLAGILFQLFVAIVMASPSEVRNEPVTIPSLRCGETLQEAGSFLLPMHSECIVKISIPEGSTSTFFLLGERKFLLGGEREVDCDLIQIRDAQGKVIPCETARDFRVVSNTNFTLKMLNVSDHVLINLKYSRTSYDCFEVTDSHMYNTQFSISYNTDECVLKINTVGLLRLRLAAKSEGDTMCPTSAMILQGGQMDETPLESPTECLSFDRDAEFELYCGYHILQLTGETAKINATVVPFTRAQELRSRFKRRECLQI